MREADVILFGVENNGDLKREYPELKNIEEFQDLTPSELRFCWLVGNRTSPIFNNERVVKWKKALEIVWGSNYSKNDKIKEIKDAGGIEEYIPENILKGILKMSSFNPGYRLKAKLMSEYIFETLSKMIVLDERDMLEMDVDDKKKYSDFVIKVSSELQDMVGRLENAYGIKTVNRKTKSSILIGINDVIG